MDDHIIEYNKQQLEILKKKLKDKKRLENSIIKEQESFEIKIWQFYKELQSKVSDENLIKCIDIMISELSRIINMMKELDKNVNHFVISTRMKFLNKVKRLAQLQNGNIQICKDCKQDIDPKVGNIETLWCGQCMNDPC